VQERESAMVAIGWAALGLGSAFLIGATIYDATVLSPAVDDFNTISKLPLDSSGYASASAFKNSIDAAQTANLALFITGGTLFAAGTTLVLYHYLSAPDEVELEPTVMITDQGAGLVLHTRF